LFETKPSSLVSSVVFENHLSLIMFLSFPFRYEAIKAIRDERSAKLKEYYAQKDEQRKIYEEQYQMQKDLREAEKEKYRIQDELNRADEMPFTAEVRG
jgi:hypothetical protein